MKERPILFSAPMVRAILAGTKTQTRRLVKPQPPSVEDVRKIAGIEYHLADLHKSGTWSPMGPVWAVRQLRGGAAVAPTTREERLCEWRCPYGAPGDRLWVRETHARFSVGEGMDTPVPECVAFRATCDDDGGFDYVNGRGESMRLKVTKWTPAIHMPRWASRIALEVTEIRVERLHDISERDCWAEGIEELDGMLDDAEICAAAKRLGCSYEDARPTFAVLWSHINGADSWAANPWVWVVGFRRVEGEVKP